MHSIILGLITYFNPDIYMDQVIALSVYILPVIGFWALRYFSLPLVATAGYFAWRMLQPDAEHPEMGWFAGKEVMMWVMAFGLVGLVPLDFKHKYTVPILGLVTMLGYPMLYNASLNQAFMVALLPFASVWGWYWTALVLYFKSSGLSALLMLPVVAWPFFRRWPATALAFPVAVLAKVWAAPSSVASKFLPGDRLDMYRWTLDYWWKNVDPWIGGGLGSYQIYGIYIQRTYTDIAQRAVQSWNLSAHQDAIQLLFETGAIGLVLAAWLVCSTIARLQGAYRLCAISLVVCSLGYFPLDVPAFQILIAWLVLKAGRKSGA